MNHIKPNLEETHLVQKVNEGTVAFAPPRTLASSSREVLIVIDLHRSIMFESHPHDKNSNKGVTHKA